MNLGLPTSGAWHSSTCSSCHGERNQFEALAIRVHHELHVTALGRIAGHVEADFFRQYCDRKQRLADNGGSVLSSEQ